MSGLAVLPQGNDLPLLQSFPAVQELSLEIQDFYCGSDAWPLGPSCRRNSKCAAASARKLSAFLKSLFPSVRRFSFFFDFPFGEAVPYPTPGDTAMMRMLINDFQAQISRPLDIDVAILGIWDYDFDSLENVEVFCEPGWRRDELLAAWGDDGGFHDIGLHGGFHVG